MIELQENLRELFQDEDARYAYAEAYLNASIAAQIKEHRGEMNQQELAAMAGTKQPGISRLENANYSAWKVGTLRKLARAFGLRLRITFEEFGTLIPEIQNFNQSILRRRKFGDDPVFKQRGQEQPLQPQRVAEGDGSSRFSALEKLANQSTSEGTEAFAGMTPQRFITAGHSTQGIARHEPRTELTPKLRGVEPRAENSNVTGGVMPPPPLCPVIPITESSSKVKRWRGHTATPPNRRLKHARRKAVAVQPR